MSLEVVWFVVVGVFWTGFFVLEGFDFGVGALHRFVGRTDTERRVAINTIGPVWDGNEVWLVVAGAATFAAFPGWYATWFSAGYLALLLVLVALIVRGVSFEWRGKVNAHAWRGTWSGTLTVGSIFVPLLLGVALGDLLAGLPIDSSEEFTGSFWDLLTPYGLWTGLTLLVLCLLHGATFLALKTGAPVRHRAQVIASRLVWLGLVLVVGFAAWTVGLGDGGFWRGLAALIPVAGVIAAMVFLRGGHEGRSFVATALALGGTIIALFANLYPNVMVSSTNAAHNLTVTGAASADYSLKVMTVVAVIFVPLILLYQGWSYHVFRVRVQVPSDASTESESSRPVSSD